jgi:isoaspartyl peptidase/L-asparaginase-like protein (Ntn-hydrolase superfamily)
MILITNYDGLSGADTTVKFLMQKQSGLKSSIEGIKIVEADLNIHTVGMNSWPNILGEIQLDASVMDGDNRRTGAVGAIRGFKHPIEIAYRVLTDMQHEILVGEGAERFAREINATMVKNETAFSTQAWQQHLNKILTPKQLQNFPAINLLEINNKAIDPEKVFDTTVYLTLDSAKTISVATSSSGWAWKYPGRLGDSPIIGAGSYADSRYGACACTHTGEMTIRAGTARSVVLYLKMGLSLNDAVYEAAKDLTDLKTGFLGEVTIHAIDKLGNYKVVGVNSTHEIKYVYWQEGMSKAEVKIAEIVNFN